MAAGVFRKSVSWTQDAVHRLQGFWNTLYHFWRRKNLKDCNLLPNSSIACITSYQTEFIAVQPSMLLENLQILVPSQQKNNNNCFTIVDSSQSSGRLEYGILWWWQLRLLKLIRLNIMDLFEWWFIFWTQSGCHLEYGILHWWQWTDHMAYNPAYNQILQTKETNDPDSLI